MQSLNDIFQRQAQGNYMDTPQAQSFVELMRRNSENQTNNLMNSAANSQMTDEAKLTGIGRINQNESAGLGNLAMQADSYKQNALRNQQFSLQSMSMNNNMEQNRRMNSLQNIVGPLSEATNNFMGAEAMVEVGFGALFGNNRKQQAPNSATGSSTYDFVTGGKAKLPKQGKSTARDMLVINQQISLHQSDIQHHLSHK